MATIKIQNDILSSEVKTFSIDGEVTIESILKENINDSVYEDTLVECYDLETGKTYFAPLEENNEQLNAIIQVNGNDVDLSYIVKAVDIVEIAILPSGDNWSWMGAVTGFFTGSSIGFSVGQALGGGWGLLIGAAIGGVVGFIAGGIIGGVLMPKDNDIKAGSGIDSERLPDVRGATNQPMTDQPYPAVIGKHLAVPFIVGSPYNDISGAHGETNYIQVLYCVGYAPLRITDIKLGEQFLAHNQKWSGNENLENIWQGTITGTDPSSAAGSDTGEITNIWKNNDVSLEILQQVPGEPVNYGSIYPYAKLQRDIKANVLFIADGSLEEIDRGDNISYKGLGLQNGLRNNPIYFSEQYPKSLKVELDFSSGLYKTRSETVSGESTVHYYKIPMWVAIQWRVYSEDNDKADGANAGQLNLPSWNSNQQKYNLIDGKAKRGWNTFTKINKVNMGWEDNNKNPALTSSVTISYNADTTSASHGYTLTINRITTDTLMDGAFTVRFTYKRGSTPTTLDYTFPANTSRVDINRSIQFRDLSAYVKVDVIPESAGFNGGTAERTTSGNLSVAVGGQIPARQYTDAYRQADFAAHTGNTLPDSLNSGWIDQYAFNLEELGGTNDNKDGINEFRCITEVDLLDWARENLRSAGDSDETFVNKVKSYFFDSSNTTKSIEVRVVRISPNYLDETVSTSDKSAFKFSDIFTWETLTSTMLDGDELMQKNQLVQKRPMPEEDMRKLCFIALRAKTDNVDQLSNTIRKFSCVAESFAPYYDDTEKKWFPENVKTTKGYYRYVVENDEGNWIPITEQQYYDDRQNGYCEYGLKSKALPAGNNFVEQIINEVINVPSHRDAQGRIFIPNKDKEGGVYKPGCDGTLNYCNNNVASMFLLAGIGPHLGNDALGYSQNNYEENGLGDFNIDSLTKWYQWAEDVTDGSTYPSNGYHFNHDGEKITHSRGDVVHIYFTANAYIYATELLENVFANIAVAGRAVYTRDSKNRICVVIDKPELYPVGLINQKNTLKSSYTISYGELPSGIQLSFPDEDDGYTQNQLYCMTDGEDEHNPHGAIEPYTFKYVTNNTQLWSLGRYLLANRILNREVVTKQLGMEGASFALGDIIELQDDTMLIGTDNGGRITQLIEDDNKIYGFLINDSFHFTGKNEEGTQRSEQGVVIMQPSKFQEYRVITLRLAPLGTEKTVNGNLYKQIKGMTNVVLFEEEIAKSQYSQNGGDYYVYKPEVGNLVGFGIVGLVTVKYRIIKVKPAEKNKYDFTLMQYNVGLYNYGKMLPSFQNSMTVPDRSGENSFALSGNATQDDLVKAITESSKQVAGVVDSTFSKVPNVPSNLVMTVDRDKLDFSCSVVEDGISNIDYILYEIKRRDGTTKEIKGSFEESYFFNRGVDGYPEREDLAYWQIRAKAVSVYTDENDERVASTWSSYVSISSASLQQYGTWHIPNIAIAKEVVDRTVILTVTYVGTLNRTLYGTAVTKVKIKRVGNYDNEETLVNVEEVTEVPESPTVGDIIHYMGEDILEEEVILFKHGNYYRYNDQNAWVQAGRTFNEMLGIESDENFYEPEFDKSVQYSASADNEPNYRKNVVDGVYETVSYKISHTLPLIGQTSRIFKSGNIFTGTFTKDVSDYVTIPQNPNEGDVIHFIGTAEGYVTGGYYLYENGSWTAVSSKNLMVPTTYTYWFQQTNESGYETNASTFDITALSTNIADVVRSHEHYKNLYVEKLSAINANLGMISQGGMGDFESNTNCWALSDLSPEDSGVPEGVMKGTFRVGDENEYFRVTPHKSETDPTGRYYTIELKAGNIELTSDVGGSSMDFTKGTYVYNNDRTSRMALTPTGIIVQSYSGDPTTDREWTRHPELIQDLSRVFADSNGNMIVSNADVDDLPAFGYQVDGTIYHFDNYQNPENEEVGEGETPSNPESIDCSDGSVVGTSNLSPVLVDSKSCFKGILTKSMTGFGVGTIVFFSKSKKVDVCGNLINTSGQVEYNPIIRAKPYNDKMNDAYDQTKSWGEYLGLTSEQIDSDIFKNWEE